MHPGLPVVEPLDEQADILAGQHGPVVLGVPGELGQRLAGRRVPERQLTVVVGGRDIDHDLGQTAVVCHPVSVRSADGGEVSYKCAGSTYVAGNNAPFGPRSISACMADETFDLIHPVTQKTLIEPLNTGTGGPRVRRVSVMIESEIGRGYI